jgi:hypothetical protein
LETLAGDAATQPPDVSSRECTLDVLGEVAGVSTPPEDARISASSSDLVIANGASKSICESVCPGSQTAESSNRIMANQREIQEIKEALLYSLATLAPSEDSSDTEPNEATKADSEDYTRKLTIVAIPLKYELAFQFAQEILLGTVTETLLSGDEIRNLSPEGMLEQAKDAQAQSLNEQRGSQQISDDRVQEVVEEDEKIFGTIVSGVGAESTDDGSRQ